jgi:hypothetical protein
MSDLIRDLVKVCGRGAVAAGLLLGGCSLFQQPITNWEKPAGTEEQTSADLSACRAQASAVVDRDAAIDQDIYSTRAPTATGAAEPNSFTDLNAFERNNRYNRIVNDCMRQRGYLLPQSNGT